MNSLPQIVEDIWKTYLRDTPSRLKIIDVFMGFLVVVGVLQFLYCLIVGNYVSLFLSFLVFLEKDEKVVKLQD